MRVAAGDATRTYGQTTKFAGTEFTTGASQHTSGLSNCSADVWSSDAAATAHRSSGDLAVGLFGITASAAVAHTGTELTDYSVSYTAPSSTGPVSDRKSVV